MLRTEHCYRSAKTHFLVEPYSTGMRNVHLGEQLVGTGSLQHRYARGEIQVVQFSGKHPYLLNHLASPIKVWQVGGGP